MLKEQAIHPHEIVTTVLETSTLHDLTVTLFYFPIALWQRYGSDLLSPSLFKPLLLFYLIL